MPTRAWLKQQQWLALEAAREADEKALKEVPSDRWQGPEGLAEALAAKERLRAHLQTMQKKPVVVSLEIIEDQWVLVVRGMRPPIEFWEGYEIWFAKSSNVWSPTQRFGLR